MNIKDRELYKKLYPMHNLYVNTEDKYVRLSVEYKKYLFTFRRYGGQEAAIAAAKNKRDSFPASMIHSNYDVDRKRKPKTNNLPKRVFYYNSRTTGKQLGYMVQWTTRHEGRKIRKTEVFNARKIGSMEQALKQAEMFSKQINQFS